MPQNERTAYFDCFSGISGDMCLGAIVDTGVSLSALKKELKKLPVQNYNLTSKKVSRNGISATKVDVLVKNKEQRTKSKDIRKWNDIERIIKTSHLSDAIKQKGLHIFKKLFEAEAKVHGETFEKVHLHELGGIDCIVDIFGTLIGLDILGIKKIYVSPINLGSGSVMTEHGLLPVPAPATAELLKGYPVYSSGTPFELTTPTGAAIMAGLNAQSADMPELIPETIGCGAGNKDIKGMPNVLRIFIGRDAKVEASDSVTIIETNIDDMNPQIYDSVMDRLFKAGAMDVFLENIIMKKSRPAIKLTVIANEKNVDLLSDIIFRETTTIGLRFYNVKRKMLDREIKKIKTEYGDVRFKISCLKGKIINISPEYEDIKRLSKKTGMPIKELVKRAGKEVLE